MKNIYNEFYLEDLGVCINSIKNLPKMHNKRILITGATGLIGSYIVDTLMYANKLLNIDIQVIALGRSKERLEKRFQYYKGNPNLEYLEHDINEPIQKDYKLDFIIHAASNAYPAAFASDPVGTIMSNVNGTSNLLEYTREHSIERFLFISSGEVYGKCEEHIKAFAENDMGYVDTMEWRSCYPLAKRMAENQCIAYNKQFNCNVVIARPCHTYGPNVTTMDNRASAQFIRNAILGEDIILKSAGNQIRSYCYIADCVSAILTVLLDGKVANAYNIANRNSTLTVRQFAELVAKIAGRKVICADADKIEIQQQTPIEYAVLQSDKLETLGWQGSFNAIKGITHTIRILKNDHH